jgi:hypothetical protein
MFKLEVNRMNNKLICPKCKSKMEPGFRVDVLYGGYARESWLREQDAVKSIWFNITPGSVKTSKRVVTYGCQKCGYLESYIDKNNPPFKFLVFISHSQACVSNA